MHNRFIRNSLILLIVLLFVISMRSGLVDALFAIGTGVWVMSKLFDPMFRSHQGFENLAVADFIPFHDVVIHVMLGNRKLAFFVVLWWSCGILTVFLTYQLLNLLLIPS